MPSFLHSFADKAQNALNATPIGPHVQQYTSKLSSSHNNAADHPQPDKQDAPSTTKSYTFENMQHQLRVLQQQYR